LLPPSLCTQNAGRGPADRRGRSHLLSDAGVHILACDPAAAAAAAAAATAARVAAAAGIDSVSTTSPLAGARELATDSGRTCSVRFTSERLASLPCNNEIHRSPNPIHKLIVFHFYYY
jgi:carbohydrate-selective porin OprB